MADLNKKNKNERPARGRPFLFAFCAVAMTAIVAAFPCASVFAGDQSDQATLVEGESLDHRVKTEVDQFLISNGFADFLHYDKITTNAEGDLSMTGVRLQATPTTDVTVDEIRVSGLKKNNGVFVAADLELKGISAPVLKMAQDPDGYPDLLGVAALGYNVINADIFMHAALDDSKNSVSYRTTGVIRDLGAWSIDLDLGNVDAKIVKEARGIPEKGDEAIVALMRLDQMMAGALTLVRVNVTLDNSGLIAHLNAMPDGAMPTDDNSEIVVRAEALKKAGVRTPLVDKIVKAFDQWVIKGGQITVATNIKKPIRLMQGRNPKDQELAFQSFEEFLAKTNADVTYVPNASLN